MPQPFYVNPPFADMVTTTRDNRSVEHGSLFTGIDPTTVGLGHHGHHSPVHPIIPKDKPNWNGKYLTRKPPKRINNVKVR